MVIAVLADDIIKKEVESKNIAPGTEFIWADSIRSLTIIEADAFFDFLFENDPERISRLKSLLPKPVLVNSVIHTVKSTGGHFTRINGWPTMIEREKLEISLPENNELQKNRIEILLNGLSWEYVTVPDIIGMITPSIVSMIINEAWYALGEGISSKEEIDTAMKLGTNYPYGPFEWGERIGLEKIRSLLQELQKSDERYTIAPKLNEL